MHYLRPHPPLALVIYVQRVGRCLIIASRSPALGRASRFSTVNPRQGGATIAVVPSAPAFPCRGQTSPVCTIGMVAGAGARDKSAGAIDDGGVLGRGDDAGRGGSDAGRDGEEGRGAHGEGGLVSLELELGLLGPGSRTMRGSHTRVLRTGQGILDFAGIGCEESAG